MCTDYIEEKRELLEAILKGRKLSDLPKIQLVFILSLNSYAFSFLNFF